MPLSLYSAARASFPNFEPDTLKDWREAQPTNRSSFSFEHPFALIVYGNQAQSIGGMIATDGRGTASP
jgi:FAD/FMN-containing dehydrogenase